MLSYMEVFALFVGTCMAFDLYHWIKGELDR
jgi:hypothetical protein